MVIWIIGKSGSGKTFFAKKLNNYLKKKNYKIKWFDGDSFRKKYSSDLGFSLSDRKKNSKRLQILCKKYEEKKYIVLASITSLFRDHQKINRRKFIHYLQIYIKVNTRLLIKRNIRKIYSQKKNVVGLHIKFLEPYRSDFIVRNNFDKQYLKKINLISKIINVKLQKIHN